MTTNPRPPLTHEALIERLWRDLCEKDDRTSPAEYPDMLLITHAEFESAMKEVDTLSREASTPAQDAVSAERIVGVAILLPFDPGRPDPKPIFAAAPASARHHHILHQLWPIGGGRSVLDCGQGFVTDTGRYVDREEAWAIASAAKQLLPIAPTDGSGGTLYSEDVW